MRLGFARLDWLAARHLECRLGLPPGLRRFARQTARDGSSAAGAAGEELLDDPVLERVERHNHEAATRFEQKLGGEKCARELAKLVIDGDPQRLKGARRG